MLPNKRREQQQDGLLGRVALLERNNSAALERINELEANELDISRLLPYSGSAMLKESDLTLGDKSPPLVIINAHGIERTIGLPPASGRNRFFIVINNSSL